MLTPIASPPFDDSLALGKHGSFQYFVSAAGLTSNRTYTLPDASGTLALTSDITTEATSRAAADALRVLKAGDTMTGPLVVPQVKTPLIGSTLPNSSTPSIDLYANTGTTGFQSGGDVLCQWSTVVNSAKTALMQLVCLDATSYALQATSGLNIYLELDGIKPKPGNGYYSLFQYCGVQIPTAGLTFESLWVTDNQIKFTSGVADGSSAIGLRLNTSNALTTSGAKLLSLQNNSVEKLSVDKDGGLVLGPSASLTTQSGNLTIAPAGGTTNVTGSLAATLDLTAGQNIHVPNGILNAGTYLKPGSYTVSGLPSGTLGAKVYCSNLRVFNSAGTYQGAGTGTGGAVEYTSLGWVNADAQGQVAQA